MSSQRQSVADFQNAARTEGSKTTQNYKAVIKSVTTHIIPKKALQKQKCYMQRFLKKQPNMKIKDFVEWVITINDLLTCFPDAIPTVPAANMSDNKILNFLESAMPIIW